MKTRLKQRLLVLTIDTGISSSLNRILYECIKNQKIMLRTDSNSAQQKLLLPGPAGDIEAVISLSSNPQGVAVCCHPHSLHGGTLNNKVVHTLHRTFQQRGFHTVRFNFRGVGKSHGSFADGVGECEDLLAVLRWVDQTWPKLAVSLSGFSFGAFVSLKTTAKTKIESLVSVAPPVEHFYFKAITIPDIPWIIIQPMADEVVDATAVLDWYQNNKTDHSVLIEIEEASHFMHGKLVEMKQCLDQQLDIFGIGKKG